MAEIPGDESLNRVLVVPLRVADDVALARYAVPAAHAESGAVVVLDLTACGGVQVDLDALIAECHRTVRGNAQRFVVLASREFLEAAAPLAAARTQTGGPGPDMVREDDLEHCLAWAAPAGDRVFSLLITLPARMEYLAPIRRFVSGVVRALHGEADAFQVEILVDELCLNAVENSPSDRSSYEARFQCEGDGVRLEVTNAFDESINSERIMHRRLQSFDASGDYLGDRGRGLFLVGRIADGLQIRSLPEGRIRVSVTKRMGRFASPGVGSRPADRAGDSSGR